MEADVMEFMEKLKKLPDEKLRLLFTLACTLRAAQENPEALEVVRRAVDSGDTSAEAIEALQSQVLAIVER